ncbi:endonuclease domain-containing protein [Streptomyces sp. 2A115]|uniref:endonuclease domain-containing protein n=1 Tax=Streptomyces sp. 2A115 TaxID=3457439 RepID=UPI003FD4CDE9
MTAWGIHAVSRALEKQWPGLALRTRVRITGGEFAGRYATVRQGAWLYDDQARGVRPGGPHGYEVRIDIPEPERVRLRERDRARLLVTWQADRCAACGHRSPGDLVADHCHQSGLLRGLLCGICNTAEGSAPPRHPCWLSYRALTPALILGVHLPYTRAVSRRLSQALAHPDQHGSPSCRTGSLRSSRERQS